MSTLHSSYSHTPIYHLHLSFIQIYIMDTGDAHPMNIDEESDDSVEEIGNPTQSEGVA
ncbi:hypothetical protein Tco_0146609, partial [Tanacetum coccineum]